MQERRFGESILLESKLERKVKLACTLLSANEDNCKEKRTGE